MNTTLGLLLGIYQNLEFQGYQTYLARVTQRKLIHDFLSEQNFFVISRFVTDSMQL